MVGIAASAGSAQKALPPARRVLIIVQNLPVPFDRRVWHEATELAKNGYHVMVICPKGEGDMRERYSCLEGIHIYRHPLPLEAKGLAGYLLEYGSSLLWESYLACKIALRHGFDVIHACNPPDTIFMIGGFFKLFFGKKFVFDHHDLCPELYEAKFGRKSLLYSLLCWCEKRTFRLADLVISTNASYQALAMERGNVEPGKSVVVRSGPDLRRMRILPAVPTLKYGKSYLIGYVGVMGKQEGLEYLISAAAHIVHELKRRDIHFTLAGSGPSLNELKRYAAVKNVSEYITFTGRIPDEELLQILNTADLCVNPDEVNAMNDKSTMNKIMEYMALAKPIVQFDVTEGRVSAGEASLYAKANDAVDFADKIIFLLDNPELRWQMGQYGRNRVENELEWHYEAPKLLVAYDRLFTS